MSPLRGGRYSGSTEASAEPEDRDLAERFWQRVRVFAVRRIGDAGLAEDLAQETLRRVSAAMREGRIENLQALPAFVFQTARNLCLQRYRAAARESQALGRWRAEQPVDTTGADALVGLISAERATAVRRALALLAADDRSLLEQIYYEDADSAAIAKQLGITPEALRVRKHRALRRLAVLLGDRKGDVTP